MLARTVTCHTQMIIIIIYMSIISIMVIIIIVVVSRNHLESSSASATNPLHAKSARSPKPSRRQCCKTCACKSIVSAALTRCTHTCSLLVSSANADAGAVADQVEGSRAGSVNT